jgi:hypothetical protein
VSAKSISCSASHIPYLMAAAGLQTTEGDVITENDIITESDIPEPSEDFPLDPKLWESFKAFWVNKRVPTPRFFQEELEPLGYSSWKGVFVSEGFA